MSSDEVHNLAQLYERYSGPVFGYLLRLSGDRSLADELTGETFYRAMLALDGFRGEASVKTWLLRIARNLYLRRAERGRRTTSLEALQEGGASVPDPQPDPETALLGRERSRAIQRALLSLSEGDRSILLLRAQENMPGKEIAQVLGISVSAVKVRLYRARRRLAAALSEQGAD
jgi:RNA polymerase sigma-70 factor (ECF subfamily)